MKSKKSIARMAGLLSLVVALVGFFSLMYVPTTLIALGDAATTASNIRASEEVFRMGLAGEAVIFLIEVVLVALLYVLLKSVSETLSLVAALSRLSMAVVQGVNVLIGFAALLLLSGAGYLTVFVPEQLHALALLFLDLRNDGEFVWEAFFGIHLLVLGYLFVRSGYIPRILGVMVVIASSGYLIESFGNFLFPDYQAVFEWIVIALAVVPEVSLALWLLIQGVEVPQQEKVGLSSPLPPR
jgi:Domain of unknown function (DUF4386)